MILRRAYHRLPVLDQPLPWWGGVKGLAPGRCSTSIAVCYTVPNTSAQPGCGEGFATGGQKGRLVLDERARRTADRLHSAAIHLLRRLRREDVASGLSGTRLSALSVIVFAGPVTLGELADAEQVRRPTMSRLVAALEELGLVTREPNPADGRAPLLRATPAGVRLLHEGRARRTATLARDLESLPAADLTTLEAAAEILDRLARSPSTPSSDRGPR